MVTDVIEESDHKTLKTNKQTNLKNRHHILNSQHILPGIHSQYMAVVGRDFIKASCVYTPWRVIEKMFS